MSLQELQMFHWTCQVSIFRFCDWSHNCLLPIKPKLLLQATITLEKFTGTSVPANILGWNMGRRPVALPEAYSSINDTCVIHWKSDFGSFVVSKTSDDSSSAQITSKIICNIELPSAVVWLEVALMTAFEDCITHPKNLILSCFRASNVSSVAKLIQKEPMYIMFELLMTRGHRHSSLNNSTQLSFNRQCYLVST